METIFALATSRGKSGVAIVRISGDRAKYAAERLAGEVPEVKRASLRFLRDDSGRTIDQALILYFQAPHSFTGEDVVELQLHGSQAVIGAILKTLGDFNGLRAAEPGEFTRRALENNRLDLAQVEGLADLIDSETEAQRRQAMRVFSGALGKKVADWRVVAIRAAALLEATIDFADEEVPVDVTGEVLELIATLSASLDEESHGVRIAERIRDGFEVAIVGPPNIGKSTLLNALAGRDAAITSEIAGTTRDVIEVRMDLRGIPVTLLDTAGLRESIDPIEKLGVARAIKRAQEADLLVILHDGDGVEGITPGRDDIVLRGKADLGTGQTAVSGLTGQGVNALVERITRVLEERVAGSQTAIRARHRRAIEKAERALTRARDTITAGPGQAELSAEELRTAIYALDSLIGRVDVEDLLEEIFASFCLGK